MTARTNRVLEGAFSALAVLFAFTPAAQGTILKTADAGQVATFSNGMNVEHFEGTSGTALSSYAAGQVVENGSLFSSLDSTTQPTFHSGGASPGNPVGNPGTPIGIVKPTGAISGDVISGVNVAAPLVINSDPAEPWNFGFMEVIFFPGLVERVGFWITHGSVTLTLRDRGGLDLTSGDVTVTGNEGEFIGISRGDSDIAVAALLGGEAFTIDDFVYADDVPEPAGPLLLAVGAAALASRRAISARRRSRPAEPPPS